MKKLRLKALSLGAREILSREQLKAVTGGGSCNSALDCPMDYWCPHGECEYALPPDPSFPSMVSGTGCVSPKIECNCGNDTLCYEPADCSDYLQTHTC